MLTYSLLPQIAEELGLTHVRALREGELGAAIVRDREGQEFVLKASSKQAARQLARAGALVERLRARGYPAPLQVATGIARGASWSLQERLSGQTPRIMTAAHARRLIELASVHASAAGRRHHWRRDALPRVRAWTRDLASREDVRALAAELAGAVEAHGDIVLRDQDVVHGDFSHRNYLAIGDEVTGVVDWDLAGVGDWRLDLVTLAYWCAIEPSYAAPEAAAIVSDRVRETCPPDVLALFGAFLALRHLDYVALAHPERVTSTAEAIDERVAAWWRGGPRSSRRRAIA